MRFGEKERPSSHNTTVQKVTPSELASATLEVLLEEYKMRSRRQENPNKTSCILFSRRKNIKRLAIGACISTDFGNKDDVSIGLVRFGF